MTSRFRLTPADMRGMWAFVPACATADAASWKAESTIDIDALAALIDRLIRDGVDGIVTTGSAGEGHTLTNDEFRVLAETAVEAAAGRAPVFIGVSMLHTRESIARARLAAACGADGIMSGPPMYLPQSMDNALQYYRDLSEAVPDTAIMIYQNPHAFRVTLTPAVFAQVAQIRNIIAVKQTSMEIFNVIGSIKAAKDKLAILVLDQLMYPAMMFGAAGAWSIDVCLGPWPSLALRDACEKQDWEEAARISDQMQAPFTTLGLTMDEFQAFQAPWWKTAVDVAGYGRAGPARPPFVHVPDQVTESARRYARRWIGLAEKYRILREGDPRLISVHTLENSP
jgi:hydratase-aldolase